MNLRNRRGKPKPIIQAATPLADDVLSYRRKLISYHPEMEAHVIRAPESSHWEKCWSSLWVCDFLLRWWIISQEKEGKQVMSRLQFLQAKEKEGKQVVSRLQSTITNLENVN